MGQYVCRHVISFLLFLSLFIVLFIGTVTTGWFQDSNGVSYSFSGHTNDYNDYNYGYTYQYSFTGFTRYSSAINGCAFTSIGLTAICMILSFIMMCADGCCHVNKCLAVLPKVIISLATVSGILAEVACALLLAKIFDSDNYKVLNTTLHLNVRPGYSFYLVAVSGVLLLVVGCVNCRMSYDTRVDSLEVVESDQMQSQMQSQMTSFGYPAMPQGPMVPTWGAAPSGPVPLYQPPGAALMDNTPFYSNAPAQIKVFVTNEATQTSQTDLKTAANGR